MVSPASDALLQEWTSLHEGDDEGRVIDLAQRSGQMGDVQQEPHLERRRWQNGRYTYNTYRLSWKDSEPIPIDLFRSRVLRILKAKGGGQAFMPIGTFDSRVQLVKCADLKMTQVKLKAPRFENLLARLSDNLQRPQTDEVEKQIEEDRHYLLARLHTGETIPVGWDGNRIDRLIQPKSSKMPLVALTLTLAFGGALLWKGLSRKR